MYILSGRKKNTLFLLRIYCIYFVDEIRILYFINKITLYILCVRKKNTLFLLRMYILCGRNKKTLFLLRIYFEYII